MTVGDRTTTTISIVGMDCADCAKTLERALSGMPGVDTCSVQFGTGRAIVEHNGTTTLGQFSDQVTRLGYRVAEPGPAVRTFDVGGMDCADCAQTLSAALLQQSGVRTAKVDFGSGRLILDGSVEEVSDGNVRDIGRRLGFQIEPADLHLRSESPGARITRRNIELGVASGLIGIAIALSTFTSLGFLPIVLHIAAAILAGYPIARAALISIQVRRADMNLLMTIAAIGALFLRDWAEASTLMVLFGVGLALQSTSIDRTRGAIRSLLQIAPTTARVRRNDEFESIQVASVLPGDEIDVQAGEQIPIDGVVISGTSNVNKAAITGESRPIPVSPDSVVLAGSINGEARLLVRATSTGTDNTVSRIIELVENAHANKAPSQTLVERFAAVYTPIVIVGAILIGLIGLIVSSGDTEWLYRALVLLVVACPCALVISTPVAFVSAMGRASKMGVLFKGGSAVEALATVRQISFDKTGTITHGRPDVTTIQPVEGVTVDRLISIAAAIESGTSHPIARGIVRASAGLELPAVADVSVIPGMGLRGLVAGEHVTVGSPALFGAIPAEIAEAGRAIAERGETDVYVSLSGQIIGVIGVADSIRPISRSVIDRLRSMGLRTQLLTGDSATVARGIGDSVGIDEVLAGLMPVDKVAAIAAAQKRWAVAMVGDGINDAPALALARVGIAMGAGGSAAAIEAADVALMSDDLTQLPRAISLARSTRAVILQNIVFALASKIAFIGLTATGHTSLWLAVVADVGASLIVTFNALRLLKVDLDQSN